MKEQNVRAKFVAFFLSEVFEFPQKKGRWSNMDDVSQDIYKFMKLRYGVKWPDCQDFEEAIKLCGAQTKELKNNSGEWSTYGVGRIKFRNILFRVSTKDLWCLNMVLRPGVAKSIKRQDKIDLLNSFCKKLVDFETKNLNLFNEFYCDVSHINHIKQNHDL